MHQLTGLDSSFLYLETPNAPMQIAGVSIVDPRTPDGRFGLDQLRALILSRLHVSQTFTQKLVEVPLNLGKPYWETDPDFDIDRHLHRTQLPEPGGWKELSALMAWELQQILPRDRPLWDMLLVEGLDTLEGIPPGAVALISKIHHAAIDGVSGSEIMSALYDVSPHGTPRPEPDTEADTEAEKAPGKVGMLRRAGGGLLKVPGALPQALGDTVKGVVKSGALWGFQRIKPPPFPFTAPRSVFNAAVGRGRAWSPALLSLEKIKAIRKEVDATVNDVVLAICAGALRRYLGDKGQLPEKPLVAMVPVSVRADEEKGAMGNKVSAMLVSLATDLDDPRARLEAIHESASGSKIYLSAIGARSLSDVSEYIPFSLAGVGARLYTRMHLAEKHRPIFNLVITNVPGPQVPLYVGGARLLTHVGAAPVFDGMGLILPIFSYAGTLSIGATACRHLVPDIEHLTRALTESLDDLTAAIVGT